MVFPAPILNFLWSVFWSGQSRLSVSMRFCVARARLKSCGDCVYFGAGVKITGWDAIEIGSNVSIHDLCVVIGEGGVSVGDDVSIAHGCSIISTNHSWENTLLPIRDNPVLTGSVVVSNDVWIGCGVRLLAGVEVGSRVVVGANSVVNSILPPGFLYVGAPAKAVRSIIADPC